MKIEAIIRFVKNGYKRHYSALLSIIIFLQFIFILTYKNSSAKIRCDREVIDASNSDTMFHKLKSSIFYRERYVYQQGDFTILSNYILATERFGYTSSVTFVTIATLGYLDNLLNLVQFWSGPISISIYAPGPELDIALREIALLRYCDPIGPLIRSRVTFHLFFETAYRPKTNDPVGLSGSKILKGNSTLLCKDLRFQNSTYRKREHLLFPINLARNIARSNAETYFVFVADVELYPNPPQLIEIFLNLVEKRMKRDGLSMPHEKEVYALHPFELRGIFQVSEIPRTKAQLQKLVKSKAVNPFHLYACFLCHFGPKLWDWTRAVDKSTARNETNIHTSSSYVSTAAWEPFYIGSKFDPPYDESVTREHSLNKVIQVAILCHQNYTFHMLDNAFLVHKPGIRVGKTVISDRLKLKMIKICKGRILPIQYTLYGRHPDMEKCWQI